jgi:RHS repeat-associated protein
VIGWVGGGGAVLGRTDYDPFGRVLAASGIQPAPAGFAGYLPLPQSDLYALPARAYDARFGRFSSPIPSASSTVSTCTPSR